MATAIDREAIKKYFRVTLKAKIDKILKADANDPEVNKKLWRFGIFFTILLFIGGAIGEKIFVILFFIPIVIYLYAIFDAMTRGGANESEIDQCIAEGIERAKARSLQKLSLDESELVGEPVVVTGPRIRNTGGAPFLYKKGKDGRLRFTPINVTVLHMTQNQLVSYQACLDLTTGNLLNESTDEYFYKDIVSVATKTISQTVETEKFGTVQLDAAETFVLTTSGGTSVETMLRDPKIIQLMGGGDIPTTDAERAIQAIRKMLREKKQD